MKKVLLILFLFVLNHGNAVVHSSQNNTHQEISISDFVNSSNKELAKTWNTKFSFKEKVSLWILKKKLKKIIKKNPELASQKLNLPVDNEAKTEPIGVTSFYLLLSSILGGIFFWGGGIAIAVIIGGLLSLILSSISLLKHKKNPEKYKGKWMPQIAFWISFTSLVVGAIWILVAFGSLGT